MSAPIGEMTVRILASQLIHSLGFVIDHCVCANENAKHDWPAQVAEDLGNAKDMVAEVRERAAALEKIVTESFRGARDAAKKSKTRLPRKAGAVLPARKWKGVRR